MAMSGLAMPLTIELLLELVSKEFLIGKEIITLMLMK